MARCVLIGMVFICQMGVAQPAEPPPSQVRRVQSGSETVEVDPKQPYRPLPANRAHSRETIFEFYRRALNPRQVDWGKEIDRSMATLMALSVSNPHFRFSAFQTAFILVLLLICWLWWDKMRQIKWIAAECLADAINAKRIADHKAVEAINRHNRHIEMCNRVIENHESGLATGGASEELRRELREAQTQLAAERARVASLEASLRNREEIQGKLEIRIQQLEKTMLDREDGPNADLVARLQRAEAQLGNRRPQQN